MSRPSLSRFVFGAAALVALPFGLQSIAVAQGAADYPSKPITLIVPWNAGGNTDIYFRALGEAAGKELGQPVVVDNKAGGSGTLGPVTMALSTKPDGYTISQVPITVMRLPLMNKHNWDSVRDFSYIIHLSGYVLGLTTRQGEERCEIGVPFCQTKGRCVHPCMDNYSMDLAIKYCACCR